MQNTSNKYKQLIKQSDRDFKVRVQTTITLTAEEITSGRYTTYNTNKLLIADNDVLIGGLRIQDAVSSQGSFELGGGIIKQLTLELGNENDRFSYFDFDGVEFNVSVGLVIHGGEDETEEVEWIKKGVFTTEEIEEVGNTVKIIAYDDMAKFDRLYSESNLKYHTTLKNILYDACSICGVETDIENFSSDDFIVGTRSIFDENLTFRTVIKSIAQLACSFACIDVDRKLCFGWYKETNYETSEINRISKLIKVTGLEITTPSGEVLKSIADEKGYILRIQNNPLAQIDPNSVEQNPMWKPVWQRLIDLNIVPFEGHVWSDPSLEAGDSITIYDKRGTPYITPVTTVNYCIDNKTELYCDAEPIARTKRILQPTQQNFNLTNVNTIVSGQIQKLAIPQGTEKISQYAFAFKKELQRVVIPQSVKEIESNAFIYCENLTAIDIPISVTKIGSNAFSYSGLKTAKISGDLDNYSFTSCQKLVSVTLLNTVTEIKNGAFSNCKSLQSIVIPNSVTAIDRSVFSQCSQLETVKILAPITKIPGNSFEWCECLQSVQLSNTITEIGEYAFYNCKALKNIDLPTNLKTIVYLAFKGCESLESVWIPNGVQKVDNGAFSECTNLKFMRLPKDCEISDGNFSSPNLTEIQLENGFNTDLNLYSTNLSVDVIVAMFYALADLTGQDSKSIYLGYALDKLSSEQKQIATNKNWLLH